jgi:histidinol-phosphate/aromatic aminotransferase/cobyric acid decarboxylase-like protein
VWVDETYVEYAGPGQSLEGEAARGRTVVVCKSMSKVYALSGSRVGYLCGPAEWLEELRPLTPPYAVSLPAQVAAVAALGEADYYAARWAETHALREQLAGGLRATGRVEVVPGVANFLLCRLAEDGPDAATVLARCRARGLFLRNAAGMGSCLGGRAIRVAVKDAGTNRKILEIVGAALGAERTEVSRRGATLQRGGPGRARVNRNGGPGLIVEGVQHFEAVAVPTRFQGVVTPAGFPAL